MPDDAAARELLLKQILSGLNELKGIPADMAIVMKDLQDLKECVQQNNRTLRGKNGDPGIVDLLTRIDTARKDDHDEIVHIKKMINGDPDDHEKTGLKGDVKDIRQEIDKYRRYQWFLFTSLVGMVIALVLQHISL